MKRPLVNAALVAIVILVASRLNMLEPNVPA